SLAGHGTQAVVRVGEPQARAQSGKQGCGLQKEAPERRHVRRLTEKSTAEREIRLLFDKRGDQRGNIAGSVLAVAVESDNEFGRVRQRVIDAGLQGSALAEIDGMADGGGTECKRDFRGSVARTV